MELLKLLNESLELLETSSKIEPIGIRNWLTEDLTIYISNQNIEVFNQNLENIYTINNNIYTRFTRKKIYKIIEDKIIEQKKNTKQFTKEIAEELFTKLEEQKAFSRYIIAPISGIRLDKLDKVNISIFEIGKANQLKSILSNDKDGYYIAVKINDIYDELLAIEEANNKFLDFIRLIVFISGKNDKTIFIKTGLPSYPSISHEKIYVESSSYHITENINDNLPSQEAKSLYPEKIPVDNEFFCKNENFIKLWEIYEQQSLNKNITKKDKKDTMEKRLLNASLAIGESALNRNKKNSIIYTSMALEILFSLNEKSLYQQSIGDKLADTFAFIVAKDKETRLNAIKSIKDFYSIRSALVHGGNPEINNDYTVINIFLRAAIDELLNSEKYIDIKTISDLYTMVKEAQNSY